MPRRSVKPVRSNWSVPSAAAQVRAMAPASRSHGRASAESDYITRLRAAAGPTIYHERRREEGEAQGNEVQVLDLDIQGRQQEQGASDREHDEMCRDLHFSLPSLLLPPWVRSLRHLSVVREPILQARGWPLLNCRSGSVPF